MTKRIVIESHIPFVGNQLDGIAEVVRLAPEEITREAVADADALIVRTRTRCDASLLEGSRVGLVATATIGTDHIDKEYCHSPGHRSSISTRMQRPRRSAIRLGVCPDPPASD